MKWKSLEAVEIISPKKKKGLIAKAHKYKNCLVIDVYRDGEHYGPLCNGSGYRRI